MSATVGRQDGEHYHQAHHFQSLDHEFQSAKQGMWVFLVTEVLMFGGLFVAYAILRYLYPHMFSESNKLLDWKMGGLNTLVLITSSLTMALGVSAAKRGDRKAVTRNLALTIFFAFMFMVVKYFEYSHKFHMGIFPAGYFTYEGLQDSRAPLFFSLYFVMTGLHGLHVLIGIGLIFWCMLRNWRGEIGSKFFMPVEFVGFYWHFVDLVWIFLFPLMYLIH